MEEFDGARDNMEDVYILDKYMICNYEKVIKEMINRIDQLEIELEVLKNK